MLRTYFVQQWYGLADEAIEAFEDTIYDSQALLNFMRIDLSRTSVPVATTLMRFSHLLEAHDLTQALLVKVNIMLMERGLLMTQGTLVDATQIAALSSAKNKEHARAPQMHQAKKGNLWHFDMKANIGAGKDSGLVHTLTTTAANVSDIIQTPALLHRQESAVWAIWVTWGLRSEKTRKRRWASMSKLCSGMSPNDARPSQSWLTDGKRAWRKPTRNSRPKSEPT